MIMLYFPDPSNKSTGGKVPSRKYHVHILRPDKFRPTVLRPKLPQAKKHQPQYLFDCPSDKAVSIVSIFRTSVRSMFRGQVKLNRVPGKMRGLAEDEVLIGTSSQKTIYE